MIIKKVSLISFMILLSFSTFSQSVNFKLNHSQKVVFQYTDDGDHLDTSKNDMIFEFTGSNLSYNPSYAYDIFKRGELTLTSLTRANDAITIDMKYRVKDGYYRLEYPDVLYDIMRESINSQILIFKDFNIVIVFGEYDYENRRYRSITLYSNENSTKMTKQFLIDLANNKYE